MKLLILLLVALCYANADLVRHRRSTIEHDLRHYDHDHEWHHRHEDHAERKLIEHHDHELRKYRHRLEKLYAHRYADEHPVIGRETIPLLSSTYASLASDIATDAVKTDELLHRRAVTTDELYQLIGKINRALLLIERAKHITVRLNRIHSAQRSVGIDPYYIVRGEFTVPAASNYDCELVIREDNVDTDYRDIALKCGSIVYQVVEGAKHKF